MKRNPFYSFIAYLSLFVLLGALIFPIPAARASGAGIMRSPVSTALGDEHLFGSFQETTGQIMARQAKLPLTSAMSWQDTRYPLSPFENASLHKPGQRPKSNAAQAVGNAQTTPEQPSSPLVVGAQSVGITFNSINADQAFPINANHGFTPPDTMGVVGPTQFLTVLNGAIRTSNKSNGATGFLNTSLDNFFTTVRGGAGTGDPRVRFDRLTDRWVVIAFTQSATNNTNNRILIAASNPTTEDITAGTVWTFYYFLPSVVIPAEVNLFADYPTLGIDANALYISVGLFNASDAFQNTSAFVIKKSTLYGNSGGDISALALITGFSNLAKCSGCDGMFAAQGADNYNSTGSDAGYFISPSLSKDNRIIIRRVTNMAATPTLGSELVVAVPQGLVYAGLSVDTADSGSNIDALEWRMLAAHLRDGHLWTTNTQFVNAAGAVTKIGAGSRAAVRFYDIDVTNPNPALVQTGTIYDSTASNPFNYWMGTVMVSGQGHAALGFSRTSGASGAANWPAAATVGRLASDAPGTVQGPPIVYQAGAALYDGYSFDSIPSRWGDYSMTSLDPCDDMTIWTVQEYSGALGGVSGTNFGANWATAVAQLKAPAPTITSTVPSILPANSNAVTVTINGSGFYNPPLTGMSACRKEINTSSVFPGLVIDQLTFVNDHQLIVKLNTGPTGGLANLTITNPDGQQVNAPLTINGQLPVSFSAFPNPANEGSPVTFTGLFTDTSALTPEAVASIHWDFGDGVSTTGVLTTTHTYLDNGVYTPTLVVTGTSSAVGSATLPLTINNVAPQVNAGPDQDGIVGQSINFTGTYTEPGKLDTPVVLWDFGDTFTATGTLTPTHNFSSSGVYTVTLSVKDKDGGTGSDALVVSVKSPNVYLPVLIRSATPVANRVSLLPEPKLALPAKPVAK